MAYITMEYLAIILYVLPAMVTSISVSPNGNSPQVKMVGGMVVEKGFVPITTTTETTTLSNYEKSRRINNNKTTLSINERYRRLIPYMTFYYANDLPTTTVSSKTIEVEKAEIVEADNLETNHRQPKKILYSSSYRQIPRYQGNRLSHYNIASANPVKVFYKNGVPIYEGLGNVTPHKNPLISNYQEDYDARRYIQKYTTKTPAVTFIQPTRKPYINLYSEENSNVRYYVQPKQKDHTPKYKLVPYEQTPPVKVQPQNENAYEVRKPVIVSVLVPKELYVKPRPVRPPFLYESVNQQARKQPSIVSENYYEKQRPNAVTVEPVIEGGFKPIVAPREYTTATPIYKTTIAETPITHYDIENQSTPFVQSAPIPPAATAKPEYFQYVVDKPVVKPTKHTVPNTASLATLLNSLQVNKSIPKPITTDNVASSIKTLLEVLNSLKTSQLPHVAEHVALSTPKPFVASKVVTQVPIQPEVVVTQRPVVNNAELHDYLAEVETPSQHLDEHPLLTGTSQQFPLPVTSDDEGGTPGRPGIDYPTLTTIPHTSFDCKTQRYKGFFADTETRCQVWHYCDLNGGQASFLCPNGTIFSQAALTCDWWFNVRCDSTAQLYVLNESLYKYILPHSPKFPEDYSGPLVDKYLTLKFKEMEEEFQKKKGKGAAHKSDDDDEDNRTSDENTSAEVDKRQLGYLSEASVIIESPGNSGKVERLIDE